MTPSSAILLGLLVPGLPQILAGKLLRGLIGLLLAVTMFFVGYAILQEHLWHLRLFEPFGLLGPVFKLLPLNLLPDGLNGGCGMIASLLNSVPAEEAELAEYMRRVALPRDGEHLGFFLTGSSGIVSCLWAADAHWQALQAADQEARPGLQVKRRCNPALAAGLSWMLPGSGHALAGQKSKGQLMGAAVILMFALGLLLSAGHAVDRELASTWWIPQSLFGGGSLFAALVTGPMRLSDPLPQYLALGQTLCAVAGLMNLVVMVDAYTVAERGEGSAEEPTETTQEVVVEAAAEGEPA